MLYGTEFEIARFLCLYLRCFFVPERYYKVIHKRTYRKVAYVLQVLFLLGNLPRFWVDMCPRFWVDMCPEPKSRPITGGKMFHLKTPKTCENDLNLLILSDLRYNPCKNFNPRTRFLQLLHLEFTIWFNIVMLYKESSQINPIVSTFGGGEKRKYVNQVSE